MHFSPLLKTLSGTALAAVLATALAWAATTGATPAEAPAAEVAKTVITYGELEDAVRGELQALENQRHQLLEGALDRLVAERLLELEAQHRGLSGSELAEQIAADVEAVSDEDVDRWYEQNKARVGRPKETVGEQIRDYLTAQRSEEARRAAIQQARQRFAVDKHLEPLRIELDLSRASTRGPDDAPVTLAEFSDFQCPACRRLHPVLEQLHQRYGEKLRIAFLQFPLDFHPQAAGAAEASLCAREQGKFWEMHDAMFARQGELQRAQLVERATELGLDVAGFERCLDAGTYRDHVDHDLEVGRKAGVSGTPWLFVNGRPVNLQGSRRAPGDQLAEVIDDELARASR